MHLIGFLALYTAASDWLLPFVLPQLINCLASCTTASDWLSFPVYRKHLIGCCAVVMLLHLIGCLSLCTDASD
jgi:hypothetical protein